jgi:D-glycero-D-manno-heptose 1,7-bisphosphate phosphatase
MTAQPIRQACILVGGKGTRLGDLTRATPKPLIEIGNSNAFLDIAIEQVARQGFDDIVLLAGYFGDLVRARYDGRAIGAAQIRVVVETEPLGTAGAFAAARDLMAPRFLTVNGDTFFDIDLRMLCTAADDSDCDAMLALHRVADASRYGSVVLEGDRIVSFREKAKAAGPALINGGIAVVRAGLIDRVRALPCSMEAEIFPVLAVERRLGGRECQGYFIDIGVPETLEQARRELIALTQRPAPVAR